MAHPQRVSQRPNWVHCTPLDPLSTLPHVWGPSDNFEGRTTPCTHTSISPFWGARACLARAWDQPPRPLAGPVRPQTGSGRPTHPRTRVCPPKSTRVHRLPMHGRHGCRHGVHGRCTRVPSCPAPSPGLLYACLTSLTAQEHRLNAPKPAMVRSRFVHVVGPWRAVARGVGPARPQTGPSTP